MQKVELIIETNDMNSLRDLVVTSFILQASNHFSDIYMYHRRADSTSRISLSQTCKRFLSTYELTDNNYAKNIVNREYVIHTRTV